MLSGSLGSAIGTFFFTESLRYLNTSVANVLLNFQPVVSVAFAALLLREKLHWRFFVWAAAALICGSLIVVGDFSFKDLQMNIGLLFIGLTALSWGFSTVAGRGTMLEMPLTTAVFLRFLSGFVTLFIVILVEGKIRLLRWDTVPAHFADFVGLSLFAGVVPLFFYFKGLAKTPASIGGFCEMTQTIAAVLVTWGVLGDKLSPMQSIGAVLLMFTIYKLNSQPSRTVEHA
jgi:probable blue pigment (indigoidine) exporter